MYCKEHKSMVPSSLAQIKQACEGTPDDTGKCVYKLVLASMSIIGHFLAIDYLDLQVITLEVSGTWWLYFIDFIQASF